MSPYSWGKTLYLLLNEKTIFRLKQREFLEFQLSFSYPERDKYL